MSRLTRFLKHNKDDENSRNSRSTTNTARPKLCILATKPSVPSQPQTTEWSLDLCIPPPPPPQTPTSATTRKSSTTIEGLSHLLHKHKVDEPSTVTSEATVPDAKTTDEIIEEPEKHYYFSRLTFDSHSETRPNDVVLEIFLTSFPAGASPQTAHAELIEHFGKALEAVHLTPDSGLWLRQALYALQSAEIIPPISHGLDVTKFMSFATSYLAQHLEETDDQDVKQVNYSKILRENDRLKNMFGSGGAQYADANVANDKSDELAHHEDVWNLPVRDDRPAKAEKHWGGFWVTYGSGASGDGNNSSESRDNLQRRDVYGGLM